MVAGMAATGSFSDYSLGLDGQYVEGSEIVNQYENMCAK